MDMLLMNALMNFHLVFFYTFIIKNKVLHSPFTNYDKICYTPTFQYLKKSNIYTNIHINQGLYLNHLICLFDVSVKGFHQLSQQYNIRLQVLHRLVLLLGPFCWTYTNTVWKKNQQK